MTVLLGIIAFHLLVMVRAKQAISDRIPFLTVFVLTALMVAYVVFKMYGIQPPE